MMTMKATTEANVEAARETKCYKLQVSYWNQCVVVAVKMFIF